MTWISLAVVTAAFVLAGWVFLRAQGVETWETTRGQRWTIAFVSPAMILAAESCWRTPTTTKPRPVRISLQPSRGIFGRASGSVALVPPGASCPPVAAARF